MQTLVYSAQPGAASSRPMPPSADGEVVLRIDAAGICGSDMHAYHGHDPRRKPGLVLGHEFAATIHTSAASGWRVGRRVTGNPLITCGRCDYCVQGRDNLCSDRTMVGMTRPGAFAQRMSIPAQCLIESAGHTGCGAGGADRTGSDGAARDQSFDACARAPAARMPGAGDRRWCDRHARGTVAAPLWRRSVEGGGGQSTAPRVDRGDTRDARPTIPRTLRRNRRSNS